MKSMKEFMISTIITIVLALVIAFGISGTVIGQSKGCDRDRERYYRTAEQEYVQEIRNLLEEKGYCNSGITMNRVIEEDGTREYTITIHHRRIDRLCDEQKDALIAECQSIAFPVENCNFCHEFLETDL